MTTLPTVRQTAEIDEFLEELKSPAAPPSTPAGRLIFALDATASRGPTWDQACMIQGEMFAATATIGGLELQLMFYRGFSECKVSRWLSSAAELHRAMSGVSCVGGHTQLARVLEHTVRTTKTQKVAALVFVGDAFEEKIDGVCAPAGELGKLGTPAFLFQEGENSAVTSVFKQIAGLSGGAHFAFNLAAIDKLKELLGAVAAYAAGGLPALQSYSAGKTGEVLRLTSRLRR